MAIDFGDTIMEGGIAPAVQQQNPVQDNTGLYLADAAKSALTGVGAVFGGMVKQGMENEANSVLNAYRQEAVMLADAVDQGSLSLPAARSRLRVLYSNAIANNPALGEDIDDLHSSLMNQYGIGSVIQEGNEDTQRLQDFADEAASNGWFNADGTADVEGYNRWQITSRQVSAELQDLQLRAAQRGELNAVEKERLDTAIRQIASAGYPWVQDQVGVAATAIDNGADPGETIQNLRATVQAQINQFTTASQGEDISYITEPMQQLVQTFEDFALGKTTKEVMDAQVASINAREQYMLMSDPEIARTVAVSELFGTNASAILAHQSTKLATQIFGQNNREYDPETPTRPADVIGTEGDVGTYFQNLREDMGGAISAEGGPTPGQIREVGNQKINILRGIVLHGAEGVQDYRNAIDHFASVEEQRWVESGLLSVPAEVAQEASHIIEDNYANVLLPLVNEVWHGEARSVVGGWGTGREIVSDIVDPVWNGSSLTFTPKQEWASNPRAVSLARALNQGENSIAIPFNTLTRAMAHMEGHNDYGSKWSVLGENIFAEVPEEGEDAGSIMGSMAQGSTETGATLDVGVVQEVDTPPERMTALQALEPFSEQVEQEVVGSEGNWYTSDVTTNINTLASLPSPEGLTLQDFNAEMPVALERAQEIIRGTGAEDPARMLNASTPIEVASAYLGLSEERDMDNITLSRFIRSTAGIDINPAKTAWCAAFVDAILHASNQGGGTGKLNARSYLNWGVPVDEPRRGDVVVFSRGDPNGWQGHVGFFEGYDENGNIRVLGGNQGNSVSVTSYSPERLLGFRRAG